MQIRHVAAAAFAELGVENTTMSEIVARMGGSKATLYNYFPSKADLVQSVLAQASEIRLQQAFQALDATRPIAAMLHEFGKGYLEQLLSPEMLSAMRMAQQDGYRNDNGKRFYALGPQIGWGLMQKYLGQKLAAGVIAECDAGVASMHLKGLLQGELLDRAMLGEMNVTKRAISLAASRAVDAFLRAYLAR